jgi:hypothetical protein
MTQLPSSRFLAKWKPKARVDRLKNEMIVRSAAGAKLGLPDISLQFPIRNVPGSRDISNLAEIHPWFSLSSTKLTTDAKFYG